MKVIVQCMVFLAVIACVKAGACDANPCQNNGDCVESGGSYTCTCTSDYTGTNCETAGNDFPHWTDAYTGGICGWDEEESNCGICATDGVQCPYHTFPAACVMKGDYSQHRFCCDTLGIMVTCEDEVWVYADGQQIGHSADVTSPVYAHIDSSVSVIAVKCLAKSGNGGVLASFSNEQMSSMDGWMCTDTEVEGWNEADYTYPPHPSGWSIPLEYAEHDEDGWEFVEDISEDAKWIWQETASQGKLNNVYNYFRCEIDWNIQDECMERVVEHFGTIPPTTTPEATTPLSTASSTEADTGSSTTSDGNSNNGGNDGGDDGGQDGDDGDDGDNGSDGGSNNAGGADAQEGEEDDTPFGPVGSAQMIGSIVGIILGALILLVTCSCCIYCLCARRKKKKKEEEDEEKQKIQTQQAWSANSTGKMPAVSN